MQLFFYIPGKVMVEQDQLVAFLKLGRALQVLYIYFLINYFEINNKIILRFLKKMFLNLI